jgi:hypothetical protein
VHNNNNNNNDDDDDNTERLTVIIMSTNRHPGKILHGLGFVSDEADVACNLLQDIKRHSENYVTAEAHTGQAKLWHPIHVDAVCGSGEEVKKREDRILSRNATTLVSWVNAVRDTETVFSTNGMPFQPFQNLIVMDFLFYLIMKLCPTEVDVIIHRCKRALSLQDVTTEEIRAMLDRFSIKHSVYIIPRRHGKTSMFTALMAATVLFVDNIVIGYGCHRSKPLQETYIATVNTVRRIRERSDELSRLKVKTRKGETIHVYNNHETQSTSSILFISLQNDKVNPTPLPLPHSPWAFYGFRP